MGGFSEGGLHNGLFITCFSFYVLMQPVKGYMVMRVWRPLLMKKSSSSGSSNYKLAVPLSKQNEMGYPWSGNNPYQYQQMRAVYSTGPGYELPNEAKTEPGVLTKLCCACFSISHHEGRTWSYVGALLTWVALHFVGKTIIDPLLGG